MAARLTDRDKKKIVADYLRLESYSAVAKLNGRSDTTVKKVVEEMGDFRQKAEQKKEQNTKDILEYMESQRDRVCEIIDAGLKVLPQKVTDAKSATEVTTALGTLIDKWTNVNSTKSGDVEDLTPLADMLKE